MKTLFLASMLVTGTAFAQVNIDQALQIRNEKMVVTATGTSVGRIDADAIKKATSSLKGNIAIQFGKNESLQLNNQATSNRSGGVIVGSGTNGDKSTVKVSPPLRPAMGVTVTGREGSLNHKSDFCARFLDAIPKKNFAGCVPVGAQLRLPFEGKYLLFLSTHYKAGTSSLEIFVRNGEQLVIPLREIQIDSYAELQGHSLSVEITAKEEQRKLRIFAQIYRSLQDLVENTITYSSTSADLGLVGGTSNDNGVSATFYNVFPGTYEMIWIFPHGQIDFTKNIIVE